MLWNNLIAASKWVISIFKARGRLYVVKQSRCCLQVGCLHLWVREQLYVMNVTTAMEGCTARRIKQYFIQKYSTWIEIGRRYILVSGLGSQTIALYCVITCCSLEGWMFGYPNAASGVSRGSNSGWSGVLCLHGRSSTSPTQGVKGCVGAVFGV